MSEEKKIGVRQVWNMTFRGWKLYWKLCPGWFVSEFLRDMVRAVSPYVTIWISAQLIGELAGARDPRQLLRWVVIQLVAGAAMSLLAGVLERWNNYEDERMIRLESKLYADKMMELDYADVDRQAVQDLYSTIAQNRSWAGWGLTMTTDCFGKLVYGMISMLCGIGLTVSLFVQRVPAGHALSFLNHPLFAAGMAVLMLLISVAAPMCTNRGDRYWSRIAEDSRLRNRYFTFFGWMCTDRKRATDLRVYDQEDQVCIPYAQEDETFTPKSRIAKYMRGPQGMWYVAGQSVSVVLTGCVYLFVCLKAWAGAFGVGAITQYVGAITNLFSGISQLLEPHGLVSTNAEFLKLCYEFLDIPNGMYRGSLTTEKRSDRQYQVEFRDVSFRYPGSDQWALRHVNMEFQVGKRLAIVGENGSGKTTFIKLLCRLYDPTEGQILLNGIDIRKYQYRDYMELFSVVFQDFRLFSQPLGANVAGSSTYDPIRARRALEDAGFDKRLSEMKDGLDTMLYKELSADGVEISGGEAQKIAIARSLYKNAPFIILDEPTAALDPIAEAEIYSKFNDISGDKTAVYISHRLSSCKFCDRIAVFHGGQVVQTGTHEELVEDPQGKYHELWYAQAQYYQQTAG